MALLTWRILILLRVVAHTQNPPKFTQEWFKTFALHTTLYVFMWSFPSAASLLQLFKSNNALRDYSTRPVSAKFNNG